MMVAIFFFSCPRMSDISQPKAPAPQAPEQAEERESQSAATPPLPVPVRLPPLFELGKVFATPGALEALRDAATEAASLLHRHQRGDWGDLDAEDRAVNRRALLFGERLLSAYLLPETGEKIWIMTEADRGSTTLLLPSEY